MVFKFILKALQEAFPNPSRKFYLDQKRKEKTSSLGAVNPFYGVLTLVHLPDGVNDSLAYERGKSGPFSIHLSLHKPLYSSKNRNFRDIKNLGRLWSIVDSFFVPFFTCVFCQGTTFSDGASKSLTIFKETRIFS